MTPPASETVADRWQRLFELASPGLSALTMSLGLLAMLGWLLDVDVLKAMVPRLSPMKFNTALLAVVGGAGLWLGTLSRNRPGSFTRIVYVCACLTLLIGILTLAEFALHLDFGIDELFVAELEPVPGASPGRMAWTSAVNFAVFGIVLYLLARNSAKYAAAIQGGATIIILIAASMVLSYIYDVESLYKERLAYTPMAVNAAAAFVFLGVAILCFHPDYLFRRIMTDPGAAGSTARRLVPVGTLLPLAGGMLVAMAHEAGYTGHNFATSLFAASMIAGFTFIVIWTAGGICRADALRRQAEQQVRSAFQYARSLIEASLDPMATIDREGKITDVNAATEEVTGFGRNELIGTDFADYFVDRDAARSGYLEVIEKGEVRDFPLTIRHRGGRTDEVLYNATIFSDGSGQFRGILAVARVVTELKRAERARAQLAAIVESTGDGIIGTTLDGIITSWNAGAEKIYGFSASEVVGSAVFTLAPVDHAGEWRTLIEQVSSGVTVANHETMRLRKDGTPIHVAMTLSPIRTERQDITGISVVVRDITEQVRAELELKRYRDHLEDEVEARTAQLQAAYREVEMFSYSVSHDLRIPLRAMDGFSRMLLEDYGDRLDDEGRRMLKVVRDNSQRMARLIDDILDFIRLGRLKMKFVPVDMASLAQAVFDELRPSTAGRDVEVRFLDMPAVVGDRAMLHQVLTNLLSNAIKFTRPRDRAVIEVSGRTEDREHVYCVRDNGVGFDMRYAGKLFGIFHRLHGIEEFEGNGTGLATVKRIVNRHGGRVWAEAEVGKGAAFHFSLPADRADMQLADAAGFLANSFEPEHGHTHLPGEGNDET